MNEEKFSVKFKQAFEGIIDSVNKAYANGIPFYMIELMLSNALQQVQVGAKLEYETDTQDKSELEIKEEGNE